MNFFGKHLSTTLIVLGIFSCGEKKMEDEVFEILEDGEENNDSALQEKNPKIAISEDGLEFKKKIDGTDTEESVGVNESGEIVYKGGFKNGKPEGEWTTFFADGKPRWKGTKRDGLNHGPFSMWYPSGRKKMDGSFSKGEKDGSEISWHLNGMKWHQRFFSQGTPVGLWKTWDDQGNLLSEVQHPDSLDPNASANQ